MIKFFRRIRQKLISDLPAGETGNKFSKYLLYAIGEIVLVVVGILIALQINNQNEFKKERQKEKEILALLKTDLNTLLSEVNEDIENAKISIRLTDSIIYYNPKTSVKSFTSYFLPTANGDHFLNNVMLFPSKASYDNLKTIGPEIIQDVQLRFKITDLYERLLYRTTIWENLVYDYEAKILSLSEKHFKKIPVPSKAIKFAFAPRDYKSYMELNEFQNALVTYQARRGTTLLRYHKVKEQVEEILALLKNNK